MKSQLLYYFPFQHILHCLQTLIKTTITSHDILCNNIQVCHISVEENTPYFSKLLPTAHFKDFSPTNPGYVNLIHLIYYFIFLCMVYRHLNMTFILLIIKLYENLLYHKCWARQFSWGHGVNHSETTKHCFT